MDLIQFDVHYEEPSNVEDYTTGDQMETDEYNTDQDLWIKTEEDDNGEAVYEPITEVATYNAPRLHTVRTGSDVDVAFVPIKQEQVDLKFSQIKNLSENDKQLAKEQFGDAPVKVDVEKP